MKKKRGWSVATRQRRTDAFGIYRRDRPMFKERVKRVRSLSDQEREGLKRSGHYKEFLDIKSGSLHSYGGGTGSVSMYEMAAGKREILGTLVGDGLKLIKEGRLEELKKDHAHFQMVIKVLEMPGIADRKTGRIDGRAVEECLKKNRIIYKR